MNELITALLTVGIPVYHFTAHEQKDKYIVWAEDTQGNALWADNKMDEQSFQGTIDFFTREEDDQHFNDIQNALNDAEISFRLSSVQHEDDTGYIHYEWIFEV